MGSIFQHQHPTLLFRFPKLIYFSYGLNWLIRLRKWYIHAALLPLIRSTKKTSYVLDAGVGDGQFIIPYAKTNQKKHLLINPNTWYNISIQQTSSDIITFGGSVLWTEIENVNSLIAST